jgi:UV DNA damage endonuclease
LLYHSRVLDSLGLDQQHKIVLHIGGVYQDKEAAIHRFMENCRALPERIRRRLVLENDDRSYHAADVLAIAGRLGLPAVYDNLHAQVNPDPGGMAFPEMIRAFGTTWKGQDGPQKIHYSQQDRKKKPGSHSASIGIEAFLDYAAQLPDQDIDVMLEVKDKNLSAVKCILCTQPGTAVKDLEEEWKRYKYKVLEKSQTAYDQIRRLLSDKSQAQPVAFYRLVEEALAEGDDPGSQINASLHVWGYFKKTATAGERDKFFKLVRDVEDGNANGDAMRKMLLRMVNRYDQPYLKESYYFYLE